MLKVGDEVTRMLAGSIPMTLRGVAIDDKFIHCGGGWKFDKATGAEIDEELGWNVNSTGSYLQGIYKIPKAKDL